MWQRNSVVVGGCLGLLAACLLLSLKYELAPRGVRARTQVHVQDNADMQQVVQYLLDQHAAALQKVHEAQAAKAAADKTAAQKLADTASQLDALKLRLTKNYAGSTVSILSPEDSVRESATLGKTLLQQKQVNTTDRLLIPLLLTGQLDGLCCILENIAAMVLPKTPADVWVISTGNSAQEHLKKNCTHLGAQNIFFLPLREWWHVPDAAGPPEGWAASRFGKSYRMMGHWRLGFQMPFARALGYPYVLQMDIDSEFRSVVAFNFVDRMRNASLVMAAQKVVADKTNVTWGLPELMRWFVTSERLTPSTLLDHCSPKSLAGLVTTNKAPFRENFDRDDQGGWDKKVPYGNCVLLSTEFWFQPLVQKWLNLVLYTGGHFRFRWQEQAVVAMIWQTFVPKGQFALLDLDYKHPGNCSNRQVE